MNTERLDSDRSSFKIKAKEGLRRTWNNTISALTPKIAQGVADEGSQKKEATKARLFLFSGVFIPALIAGMAYLIRQSDESKIVLEGTSALTVVIEAFLIQITREISKETKASKIKND